MRIIGGQVDDAQKKKLQIFREKIEILPEVQEQRVEGKTESACERYFDVKTHRQKAGASR